jgi:hypothetical protein
LIPGPDRFASGNVLRRQSPPRVPSPSSWRLPPSRSPNCSRSRSPRRSRSRSPRGSCSSIRRSRSPGPRRKLSRFSSSRFDLHTRRLSPIRSRTRKRSQSSPPGKGIPRRVSPSRLANKSVLDSAKPLSKETMFINSLSRKQLLLKLELESSLPQELLNSFSVDQMRLALSHASKEVSLPV